jgi:hypothetical protein
VVVVLKPVMSTLYEPGIVELTLRVATYEPLVTVVGWMDAFKFWELDEAKRSTDDANPFVGLIIMVEVVGVPAVTVTGDGLAVM